MRCSKILTISVCSFFLFLSGCALFNDPGKPPVDNVARSISPEVASQGASVRKKPAQPPSAPTIIDDNMLLEPGAEGFASGVKYDKLSCDTYVVKNGDTIYGISKRFGSPSSLIMELNGLSKESKIYVGQKLAICKSDAAVVGKKNIPFEASPKCGTYVIQAGDTLSGIAKKHNTSVQAIKELNSLSSDKIMIGCKLAIPAGKLAIPAGASIVETPKLGIAQEKKSGLIGQDGRYVVGQGDTLSSIAHRLSVKQEDLQRANNITNPDKLKVGQKLSIPSNIIEKKAETFAPKPETSYISRPKVDRPQSLASRPSKNSSGSDDMYLIKSGDSIEKIARELGVLEADLMEANNISKASQIQAGKKLLVPQKKIAAEAVKQPASSSGTGSDFFDSFEEIPVVEINN